MDAHLPICKGAKVEDVFTTCFRMFGFYFILFFKNKGLFFGDCPLLKPLWMAVNEESGMMD